MRVTAAAAVPQVTPGCSLLLVRCYSRPLQPWFAAPGKLATALREGLLPASVLAARLCVLVLDEADLLLSYGYEEDLMLLAPQVRHKGSTMYGVRQHACATVRSRRGSRGMD